MNRFVTFFFTNKQSDLNCKRKVFADEKKIDKKDLARFLGKEIHIVITQVLTPKTNNILSLCTHPLYISRRYSIRFSGILRAEYYNDLTWQFAL